MPSTLIKNALIVNEGKSFKGSILIKGSLIEQILSENAPLPKADTEIDAEGLLLVPGAIDDQVHFREPGLTDKGDIATESAAAVAGGVTSYMEMPNTNPQTVTIDELENKYRLGAEKSLANYSFYMGTTNNNVKEVLKVDPQKVCGIKIFMGSSTGNMLVDNKETLNNLFREIPMLIATHCEDEHIIQKNLAIYKQKYGENMPFKYHPEIRSSEACYKSSSLAVELATKYNSRLHILHLSSEKELSLLNGTLPLEQKRITGEACVHHLWFAQEDYEKYGSHIKWNPAVKRQTDRDALREGLKSNLLDVVATDHAPHTLDEKNNNYFKAPSGGPLVQHSLIAMMEMAEQGIFTRELVVEKMSHAPATLFRIEKRGFIREGYYADLVLLNPNANETVTVESLKYKCGWSTFTGTTFKYAVKNTWVNGNLVYENGSIYSKQKGERIVFKAL